MYTDLFRILIIFWTQMEYFANSNPDLCPARRNWNKIRKKTTLKAYKQTLKMKSVTYYAFRKLFDVNMHIHIPLDNQ